MHAKTETNAKNLFLLYPATPSRGVFKILKKKFQKYPATPSGGVFKNFEKKNGMVSRKSHLRGI